MDGNDGRQSPKTLPDAHRLSKVELSEDGEQVGLRFSDPEGREHEFRFPAQWLSALVITFPNLVEKSLRLRYADPSLRLVYPAKRWSLALAGDAETMILTLATPDQFGVSFAISPESSLEIGNALLGETMAEAPEAPRPIHLN